MVGIARVLVAVSLIVVAVPAAAYAETASVADESQFLEPEPQGDGGPGPLDDAFIEPLRSSPHFAGAWVEGGVIRIGVVGDGGELGEATFDTSAAVEIVRGFRYSFVELEDEMRRLFERHRPLVGAVDEVRGRILLEFDSDTPAPTIDSQIPVDVRELDSAPSFALSDADCTTRNRCDEIRASIDVRVNTNKVTNVLCSSGGIMRSGSNYYALTAAHCGGIGATSGNLMHDDFRVGDFHSTTWTSGSTFSSDVMAFKLRQPESASRRIYQPSATHGYYDMTSWDSSVTVGEQICMSSRSYGWNCGTVSHSSITLTCSGYTLTGLMRAQGVQAVFGDSGGAMYGNGQHRGVFSCFGAGSGGFWVAGTTPSTIQSQLSLSPHSSWRPQVEMQNRNYEQPGWSSDWKMWGSGSRTRYLGGGYFGSNFIEFNCAGSSCSQYQDTTAGLNGYNPGNSFRVESYVYCNSGSACPVALAMWVNPSSTPTLAGSTSTTVSAGTWKRVSFVATIPSGVSSNQARFELYNNSSGKNIRMALPLLSRR